MTIITAPLGDCSYYPGMNWPFLVAKRVDIEVNEFSLGFGTKLLAFEKGNPVLVTDPAVGRLCTDGRDG